MFDPIRKMSLMLRSAENNVTIIDDSYRPTLISRTECRRDD